MATDETKKPEDDRDKYLAACMRAEFGVWYENGILVGGVIPFRPMPWTPGVAYWSVKR